MSGFACKDTNNFGLETLTVLGTIQSRIEKSRL